MNVLPRLSSATQDDLSELTRIAGFVATKDPHTKLKAIARGFGSSSEDVARYHSGCMQPLYDKAFQNELYDIVVAKDDVGKVLGSVVWARTRSLDETSSKDTSSLGAFQPQSIAEYDVDTLENVTNAAMQHYKSLIAPPDTSCRYIVSIAILPEYQNMGIGRALINWGLDRAESENVFCWVSSGKDAIGMFERMGFKELGRLELDLDEWAPSLLGSEEVDQQKRWGLYTWTWHKWVPTHKNQE